MNSENVTILKIDESKSIFDNEFIQEMLEKINNPDTVHLSYSRFGSNIRFIARDIEYSISSYKNGSRIDIFKFVHYNRNMDNGIQIEDVLQSLQISQLWEIIKSELTNVL